MALCMAPLFSGSGGNATYISSEKTSVLIDAGVAGKYVEQAITAVGAKCGALSGILVTHEHSDHIKSVGILSRKYDLPVYANDKTWFAMRGKIGNVAAKNVRVFDGDEFFIGDLCIEPFSTSHDAASSVGYTLWGDGGRVTVLTDTGKLTKAMVGHALGSDAVLLEANHDLEMLKTGAYPYALKQRILSGHGHLSNDVAARMAVLLAQSGVRRIILAHLSRDNNTEELAFATVREGLSDAGCVAGDDIALTVARKDAPTGRFLL